MCGLGKKNNTELQLASHNKKKGLSKKKKKSGEGGRGSINAHLYVLIYNEMFRVCMIFVTPHSAQLLSLTDPPPILTGQRRGCQCTGCPQGQSNRKDRNWKRIEGRDKVYGDSERRALPSSGRQQQVRRGPPGTIWVTCPPFLLFQGVAAAELKPEWVRSKSAPQSQVMSTYFVLSLLKKPNTGLNICFAPGFLSFCVRPG